MSWTRTKYQYSCVENLVLNILKQGILPKHVAFIMDGNRRFAASKQLQNLEGHSQGFSKLSEVLQWCHDLEIEEVSAYAFSIENFKRPQSEVNYLLNLAAEKLSELIDRIDQLTEHNIRVCVVGNLSLLPEKIQQLSAKITLLTKHHSKARLNILMAYTTQDELTHAIELVRKGVQTGIIQISDISPEVINRCLYFRSSRPLDIIVRTSGEVRLSDCMIWQASQSSAIVSFIKSNWPSLTFWHLAAIIIQFQFSRMTLKNIYNPLANHKISTLANTGTEFIENGNFNKAQRLSSFYQRVDSDYWMNLDKLVNHEGNEECYNSCLN